MGQAFAAAYGFSVLLFLSDLSAKVEPTHSEVYHFDGAPSVLFVPVLLDVAIVTIVIAAVLLMARRGRPRAIVWAVLLLSLPWVAMKQWNSITQGQLPHRLSQGLALGILGGIAFVALAWRPKYEQILEQMLPAARMALGCLSLSGLFVLGQVVFCFWQARTLNAPTVSAWRQTPGSRAAGAPERVIVFIFDELSFAQAFDGRASGLTLPAFDALAAESSVFTDVEPAAEYTEKAIPSFWTGKRVTGIRSSADGRSLYLKEAQAWTRLDNADTFFGDARRDGYRTAVAGWFIPYCRVLAQVLDRCDWHSRYTMLPFTADDRSLLSNSLMPFRMVLDAIPQFFSPRAQARSDASALERHRDDYEQIAQAADQDLEDSSLGFVLLHMPVPHQNGFYDRQRKQFMRERSSSYLDNLALADSYLGHARSLLEANGDWDRSTVVVMGDHSWRTFLWNKSPYWVPEDERVSHGGAFDDRPALLVKCAGEQTGGRLNAVFDATRTRALLDQILEGRLWNAADLRQWVER